jgi:hypothetical protein
MFGAGDLGAFGAGSLPQGESRSLADLIGEIEGSRGGRSNTARVVQHGAENRALAVQAGGRNNSLLTKQFGSDNIGVHLQVNSNNATELIQRGGGNENALLARGDVAGESGGPLTLEAMGDVRGFSVDAQGWQSYDTIRARRNGTGGLTINLGRR